MADPTLTEQPTESDLQAEERSKLAEPVANPHVHIPRHSDDAEAQLQRNLRGELSGFSVEERLAKLEKAVFPRAVVVGKVKSSPDIPLGSSESD